MIVASPENCDTTKNQIHGHREPQEDQQLQIQKGVTGAGTNGTIGSNKSGEEMGRKGENQNEDRGNLLKLTRRNNRM